MAVASRQVAFKGIDFIAEDEKAERGFQQRKQRRRKKAKKRIPAEDRDDVRYFLLFLQTHPVDERHERMTDHRRTKDLLGELLPDLNDEDERLRAFDDIVDNLRLPQATRRQHRAQTSKMKEIMRLWTMRRLYDSVLDRFLQYLRVSMGQGTLEALLSSLCEDDEDGPRRARRMAQELGQVVRGNWMNIRARNMNDGVQQNLGDFMAAMQRENAYESAQHSISTCSSGESSDEDEVEGELIF